MIVGESGKHFDPQVAEAFAHHEQRFISIREHFAEREAEAA
jgi:response regulator RpfG family c-di-GMP phosphodiesterase